MSPSLFIRRLAPISKGQSTCELKAMNSQTTPLTDSDRFKVIFEAALEAYNKTTKQSLEGHPLLTQLKSCDSPTAILDLLRGLINLNADEGLKKWLKPMIHILYAFSATLGGGISLIFSPAKVIFVVIDRGITPHTPDIKNKPKNI
ncbi:hypothetical protein EI94DRAFT_1696285 [Lactarius quietus]|nr:hypothetical protein EI94DRAFT_1696285 [Lactarius quietus]